ncbi:MAG: hypothetical protein QF382_03235, partial [Acidimicrobiales bacterium]|nr:hypothetical protein [Acidimicrobiales bacterium]
MTSLVPLRDLPGSVLETTLLSVNVNVVRLAVEGRWPGRGLLMRWMSLALRRCGGGEKAHVPSVVPGTGSCRTVGGHARLR